VVRKAPRLGASRKGRPLIFPVRGGYPRQPSGRIRPHPSSEGLPSDTQGSPRMIPSGADDNGLLDRLDHARTATERRAPELLRTERHAGTSSVATCQCRVEAAMA
jgi:hypothetical protein